MFQAAFSISAAAGINVFTLTDTSDYTDEPKDTFSGRQITIQTVNGSYLVPTGTLTDYIDFPYSGGDSITIDCMNRDYAVLLTFTCISLDPQYGSIYTTSLICGFEGYNANAEYGIERALTSNPSVEQNRLYWLSLGMVQLEIANSEQAVYYQQQASAQWAMNRATNILANQLTNFQ